jgi:transposase, IS5 family
MEGVFCTNKAFYGQGKIRIKGDNRENFAIFFRQMVACAVVIAKIKGSERESHFKK